MTGKNQSYARCLNNQMVIRELRKEACSATMLSRRLKLSNAALSAIVDDLKRKNYIKEVAPEGGQSANVGRRPVYYAINEHFGCVAVVNLSGASAKVVVADMCMNVMYSEEMHVDHYDIAVLYELVLLLKNALALPEFGNIPLFGIDLSMPGRVNTLTGELILSKQFDKDMYGEKDKVTSLFERQFGVPVVLNNDINLACLGEMHRGLLQNVSNGMLVSVDIGIGGAFILDGKLYVGSQGYAGEVGLMQTQFRGQTDALDEFVSLRAIKETVGERVGGKLHTADVVRLFGSDEWVHDYVLQTAHCLGARLKDVVELTDVSQIVISGRVALFGEEYLAAVNSEVSKSFNSCNVVQSALGNDASIIGAIAKAVENLTDKLFE